MDNREVTRHSINGILERLYRTDRDIDRLRDAHSLKYIRSMLNESIKSIDEKLESLEVSDE